MGLGVTKIGWRRYRSLAVLGVLLCGGTTSAQSSSDPPAATRVASHPLTAADVAAYFDGMFPAALKRAGIAGAVVLVVKDGEVLFSKGYGYADVRTHETFDPDSTPFRTGSAGKLFTWTAVMQLVEQGRIDLDRDVNEYLDFQIPPAFGQPITTRHLLTHTAGFEERFRDFFCDDAKTLQPLGTALRSNVPRRLFAPGAVVAYSNYGAGLAGYIVERVSGQSYADYVDQHIFRPLGMTSSTVRQPVPAQIEERLSKAYLDSDNDEPFWIEYTGWGGPAGSAATSAADMAKFMIAHLQGGSYRGAQLLRPETAQLMHRRAFTPAPALAMNAMALGFYEDSRNGRRVIGHGGSTIVFKTEVRLLLDEGVGLLMALNGPGRAGESYPLRTVAYEGFMDRYFPQPRLPMTALVSGAQHGAEVAGRYISSRRTESHYFRLASLFGQAVVTVDRDGVLDVDQITDVSGAPKRWQEIEPYVWREVGGTGFLTAVRDAQGQVKYLASDTDQTSVWQSVPAAIDASWNMPLLIGSIVTLAASVVLWPVCALVRRRYRRPLNPADRRVTLVLHGSSLLHLVFIAIWFWLLMSLVVTAPMINERLDPWLRLVQLAGLVAVGGTAFLIWQSVLRWRDAARNVWARLGVSLVALAGVFMTWFAVTFRLLWPSLG
jgi:CubicO group peptidase (beta-lactamase class C family)